MRSPLPALQQLGRALMLPIAVLPVAAILLRVGQPDLLNIAFIEAAGSAIFANLGLLFAIGIGVGLARENNGAAGLAGVVCYLVATKGAETLIAVPPSALAGLTGASADLAAAAFKTKAIAKLSVPIGILSGVIAGWLYNRYSTIRLPDYLAFFGGRRFVPIAAGFAGLALAAVFGFGWPVAQSGMDSLSQAVVGSGSIGLFFYGVLNRLLIVTGLHHVINNLAWFILGDFHGATGDLNRFFKGDPSAGAFMSGFFPVMMFGLPAACLAMYHTARPERRKAVGGMLLSIALTAFLTGVTEPIEFTFMFLAPVLYAIHAVLTGVAMALMDALGIKLGFGFSAGLFDYVLNFNKATKPLLLIPVGLAYGAVYYGLFRFMIVRFNLKTPGREPAEADAAPAPARATAAQGGRAADFISALGGAANLVTVDACTTRLRLEVRDNAVVDEPRLKALGARGVVRPSQGTLQVVLGPIADQVAGEMRDRLRAAPVLATGTAPGPRPVPVAQAVDEQLDLDALAAALGGRANVLDAGASTTRLRLDLADRSLIDEAALRRLGARAIAHVGEGGLHVILGAPSQGAAAHLAPVEA
jgi:N-acetylglucosamine PTS system EIICBA or EIICB component